MVSWEFTPNSGVAPYVLQAFLERPELISSGLFTLYVYYAGRFGYCYMTIPGDVLRNDVADILVAGGTFSDNFTQGVGECGAWSFQIIRNSDNSVVQEGVTTISRL